MAGKGGSSREFPSWSDLKSALWWSIGAIVLGAFAAEGPIKLFELFIAGVKPVETAKPGTFDWLALVLWICFPLVAGFGFALCFVQATRAMKSRIASVYTDIAQHDEARHGKALVLALSSSSSSLTGASLPGLSGEAKVESFKNSDRHNHPWQQTIRAIDHHVRWNDSGIETFPYISILTSAEANGSHKQIEDFKDLLNDLYKEELHRKGQNIDDFLRFQKEGIDFENVDDVFVCIVGEIEYLRRNRKCTEEEIVMDATGGQKPCSIAVGYVTLRSPDLLFQYVTNDGEVKNYNVDATSIEFAKL